MPHRFLFSKSTLFNNILLIIVNTFAAVIRNLYLRTLYISRSFLSKLSKPRKNTNKGNDSLIFYQDKPIFQVVPDSIYKKAI